MYKKITHHIVEEHFDHPIAAELKSRIDKTNKTTPINKKNNTKPKGYIEVYDCSSEKTQKDSISYWSQLAWRIRSLVVSITSGSTDIDSLKTQLVADIDNISNIVSLCYGKEAASQFKTLFIAVALSLADVLVKIKNDEDTTDAMKILADDTKSLGDFLESANSLWPSTAVVDILTQVENSYIMQAISRMKKEWEAADSAADGAYNILVVKQENGNSSFADIFSSGIIDCMETKIENEIYNALDYMES